MTALARCQISHNPGPGDPRAEGSPRLRAVTYKARLHGTIVAVKYLAPIVEEGPPGSNRSAGGGRGFGWLGLPNPAGSHDALQHAATCDAKSKAAAKEDEEMRRAFAQEMDTMCRVRHPHILTFIGLVEHTRPLLVFEFAPRGNLMELLAFHSVDRRGGKYIDNPKIWELHVKIAIQAAMGLTHVHALEFEHGDVKSPNILLAKNYDAKVADFGMSAFVQKRWRRRAGGGASADGGNDVGRRARELADQGRHDRAAPRGIERFPPRGRAAHGTRGGVRRGG